MVTLACVPDRPILLISAALNFLFAFWPSNTGPELELELIQTQMAQKPMLWAEVYAHAVRTSQNRKKDVRREKEV